MKVQSEAEVVRKSHTDKALERLSNTISTLQERAGQIETKLSPIFMNDSPTDKTGNDSEDSNECSVARTLNVQIDKLDNLVNLFDSWIVLHVKVLQGVNRPCLPLSLAGSQ